MRCEECEDKINDAEALERKLKRKESRKKKKISEEEAVEEIVKFLDKLSDIFTGRDWLITFDSKQKVEE